METGIFKAKKDPFIRLLCTAALILGFLPLINAIIDNSYKNIIYACIFAGAFILLLLLFTNSEYRFRRDCLEIRTGPFFERLMYGSIGGIRRLPASFGASGVVKFRLYYIGDPKNILSPADPKGFIEALKRKCPHIVFEDDNGNFKDTEV